MSKEISHVVGEALFIPAISLYQAAVKTAQTYPDAPAMYFYDRTIPYRDFLTAVERLSAFWAEQGIAKGDRVGIMLPNCPHYVIAFYACARLGAVVVQVNPMYTPREVEYTLTDSGAKALVVFDRLYAALVDNASVQALQSVLLASFAPFPADAERPANVVLWDEALARDLEIPEPAILDPAEDVAVLQYTGGTTGRSKGAMLTHENLVANTYQLLAVIGSDIAGGVDKILTAIPLFHVYGMTVAMNMAVFTGASMILLPRFELEELLKTIQHHRPRFFPGVPTMYVAIANHPDAQQYDVDCIEICNSGSAPLPVEVMHKFEQRTGANVLEGYGLSEASPVTHSNRATHPKVPGSIGLVIPATEAKIVDLGTGDDVQGVGEIGELVIKGPQVMKGYWNMPQDTAHTLRNGWLYTGDIARMDENGYFYIVDRKKDMILSGGFNVYPRDIEEVLYQHPSVQEAVVVGVPDEYRGESAKAVIVLREGIDPSGVEEELNDWCRERLAAYKIPRLYEFRAELPKTAVGKILRRALRDA
ncbi:long-chain-fatty-acid--CoA ligase [Tumebacillus flagellatus]|uniref:AMP-dependent synthetase n=1 Tax=Tumebacillus flagellatus TaxID=1157490 RepID=A0A074LKI1_9BACL|nr:long-chain fatty acid--CoA ligase [Tumebacillus flagellatus]KEO82621.1 AMP-dependent synthetase [Tumebacillus flagellatus]